MTSTSRPVALVLAARRSGRARIARHPRAGPQDSAVLAMILEPSPRLDPTTASAAAIGEVVHYNVLEA